MNTKTREKDQFKAEAILAMHDKRILKQSVAQGLLLPADAQLEVSPLLVEIMVGNYS